MRLVSSYLAVIDPNSFDLVSFQKGPANVSVEKQANANKQNSNSSRQKSFVRSQEDKKGNSHQKIAQNSNKINSKVIIYSKISVTATTKIWIFQVSTENLASQKEQKVKGSASRVSNSNSNEARQQVGGLIFR